MKELYVIVLISLIAGIFSSCSKTSMNDPPNTTAWVKVMDDVPVFFPGKIRADAENNLFCSYNYSDYAVDSNSALLKMNAAGTVLWRKEFDNLAIYDFVINSQSNPVIASFSNQNITLTEVASQDGSNNLLGTYLLPTQGGGQFAGVGYMKIF